MLLHHCAPNRNLCHRLLKNDAIAFRRPEFSSSCELGWAAASYLIPIHLNDFWEKVMVHDWTVCRLCGTIYSKWDTHHPKLYLLYGRPGARACRMWRGRSRWPLRRHRKKQRNLPEGWYLIYLQTHHEYDGHLHGVPSSLEDLDRINTLVVGMDQRTRKETHCRNEKHEWFHAR